ncbi:hypothetical protein INT45_003563 [Circinella minor]|uniref:EF-hand domain-containing protein n=1 Tax=Circinella minor TaxID=1195481 RepID=A0A8H7S1I4_9FUNG|nr:hypothetical protein INT45_003563 [Circinella minor]
MLHSNPVPAVPFDKPPKELQPVHGLNVTPEELESLRQAFRIFDIKGVGAITLTEFGKIIENLNIATNQTEIQSIAQAVDLNNDNLIDFEEFATAMIRHLIPFDQQQQQQQRNNNTLQQQQQQQHHSILNNGTKTPFSDEPSSYYATDFKSRNANIPSSTTTTTTKRNNSSKRISFYDDLELVQCFQAFDKNRDGMISRKELEDVMISLGEHMTPQEINEMMSDADTNGDGFIDFEEFKQLLPL